MKGIYKITNPNGKIYIGQSIDIEKRFYSYKKLLRCKNQKKLYNSLKKYTPELHIFEILELVEDSSKLNERERYYQLKYNSISDGLNLMITGDEHHPIVLSDESKVKISNTLTEYFANLSDEERKLIYGKSSRKGRAATFKGKKHSEDTKLKMKKSHTGRIVTESTREKIRDKMIGRVITWGDKISKANKGKSINKGKGTKQIIQYTKEGEFIKEWNSITEAHQTLNIPFNVISNTVCGYQKTGYGYLWKYK